MSIRYRIFLIVGLATSCMYMFSVFFGSVLLDKGVQEARNRSMSAYRDAVMKRKEEVERFTSLIIAQKMAQVNTVLETVANFRPLKAWFAPSEENLKRGTWNNGADLLQNDDWVQFMQNTMDSSVLSIIVPKEDGFSSFSSFPITEGVSWVYVDNSSKPKLFLGVEVPIGVMGESLEEVNVLLETGVLPVTHVLYDIEQLKSLSIEQKLQGNSDALHVPFLQGGAPNQKQFLDYLAKAVEFANDSQLLPPPPPETKPVESNKLPTYKISVLTEEFFANRLAYSDELFLIWQATALQKMGVFGSSITSPKWPAAMTFSTGKMLGGKVVFLSNVLGFEKPVFDDEAFYRANPPGLEGSFVSSGMAIVPSPHTNGVFLVNTAAIYQDDWKKRTLLSIGFDVASLIKPLLTSAGKYGYLMSGGKILLTVLPPDEQPLAVEHLSASLAALVKEKDGIIEFGGISYFFVCVRPDPSVDLQMFVLSPFEKEFDVVGKLREDVHGLIKQTIFHIHVIDFFILIALWFFLLKFSNKITKPLVELSASLKKVGKVDWDELKVPEMGEAKNDEIKGLCNAFRDMIKGMREKREGNRDLNKVVSEEIAQEILKGEIQLGGEEKIVTMLFADIRNFTQITQDMPPHEVITLLNTCMTKLSRAIEDNKGVIDKYLGDGIMALYGAPVSSGDDALHAVISGLKMMAVLKRWNAERSKEGLPIIQIGVGIHTGSVCAGNMGAQSRLNYTVIGSNVNLASRLCYAAHPEEILISEDTYRSSAVERQIEVEDKGFMAFKGFDEEKRVYKVEMLKKEFEL